MEHDNVNHAPWHVLPHGEDTPGVPPLREIAQHCYCDQGVNTCDFCAGTRHTGTEGTRQQLIKAACEAEDIFSLDELEEFASQERKGSTMVYDHGHVIFEDGHEVEFGWTGWPPDLEPDKDTPTTKDEHTRKRLAYAERVARDWAGAGYETMKIAKIWLAG